MKCLIVLLGLLYVGLTSGQTSDAGPATGRLCYSCDSQLYGGSCIHEPMYLDNETQSVRCSSPYSQCIFLFYKTERGDEFGKRGCAEDMNTSPFGQSLDVINGCQKVMGFSLCYLRCDYDFCNKQIPSRQVSSRAPALLLPGLVASVGTAMVVMMVCKTLL